jgi:hypothetical protein
MQEGLEILGLTEGKMLELPQPGIHGDYFINPKLICVIPSSLTIGRASFRVTNI